MMTPEERDALAAEYVLGTLEAREAAAVAAALPLDAALAEAVAAWEAKLAPLATLAPPEAPPPDLWRRIEAALDPARAPAAPWWHRLLDPWRVGAIGATAVAAGLAAFMVLRPAPEPRLMTVLLTDREQPAWLVEADRAGIRLASTPRAGAGPGAGIVGAAAGRDGADLARPDPGRWAHHRQPGQDPPEPGDADRDHAGTAGGLPHRPPDRADPIHRPPGAGHGFVIAIIP